MKAIISTVLAQEIVSADEVKAKLESFGLTCKEPERLKHRPKVLALRFGGEHDTLRWKRGTAIPEHSDEMTFFHMCKVDGPFSHLQLAMRDSRSPKKTCDCGDQRMG